MEKNESVVETGTVSERCRLASAALVPLRKRLKEKKRLGEIGEAAFLSKATAMGFVVSKPWGDSERYDFIVDVSGLISRVQVKSSHSLCLNGGGYPIRACPHLNSSYQDYEIDVMVAYIVPEDLWYVFPPSFFKTVTSFRIFPRRGKVISKYERFREAWHVFREAK
jgi:hypothetical protein